MLLAFTVSLLAGLATSVGGLLAVHHAVRHRSVLAAALAFAAGAMITISVVEIVPREYRELTAELGTAGGAALTVVSVLLGVAVVALIDRVLPHSLNPADVAGGEGRQGEAERRANVRLLRSGVLVAGIVGLHNIPEGLTTFVATLEDPSLGISLAVAIAVHNVPEGIAVAAPVYAATGSRRRALWWATFSGLAEPLGAVLGFVLLRLVVPEEIFAVVFGLVAGMMLMISLREMLPAALRYQSSPTPSVVGALAGAGVMLLSLALLS